MDTVHYIRPKNHSVSETEIVSLFRSKRGKTGSATVDLLEISCILQSERMENASNISDVYSKVASLKIL
jgi:hypothetical protein